ncbi:endolytic transglycosylase MltG [candidate division KSB1 bacterium]
MKTFDYFTALSPRNRLLLAAVPLLIVVAVVVLLPPGNRPAATGDQSVELVIPRGATLRSIAHRLEDSGLISRPRWFVFSSLVRGEEKSFKAGRYLVKPGTSLAAVRRMLITGTTAAYRVTVPEGLKLEETARVWAEAGVVEADQFMALAADREILDKYGVPAASLEGYLYPETFEVEHGISPRDLIDIQVGKLLEIFTPEMTKRAELLNLTRHQVISLASIIEKEAKLAHERPIVSGVFHNRLKKRRPLESCATVLYALGYHKPRLTYKDLQVKSPYNTYRRRGLPSGPICSPGRNSIMAALYPAEVDYMFFVANGDGSHTFTNKKSQHDRMRYLFKQKS